MGKIQVKTGRGEKRGNQEGEAVRREMTWGKKGEGSESKSRSQGAQRAPSGSEVSLELGKERILCRVKTANVGLGTVEEGGLDQF